MAQKTIVFDIETGPLARDIIGRIQKPFDPEAVKVGNLKDPEKIAAKVQEAKDGHLDYAVSQATLKAQYGRVLAIGYAIDDGPVKILHNEDEVKLLNDWWDVVEKRRYDEILPTMVGFYNVKFDITYLVNRCMVLAVPWPAWVYDFRHVSGNVIDIARIWQVGNYENRISLGELCRACNIPDKTGDGAKFHKMWVEDRKAALDYLTNDVEITRTLWQRIPKLR